MPCHPATGYSNLFSKPRCRATQPPAILINSPNAVMLVFSLNFENISCRVNLVMPSFRSWHGIFILVMVFGIPLVTVVSLQCGVIMRQLIVSLRPLLLSQNFTYFTYEWIMTRSVSRLLTQWKHCLLWDCVISDSVHNLGANTTNMCGILIHNISECLYKPRQT